MRNKFQLILSVTTTLLVLAGFSAFTFLSQKLIYDEVVLQAADDNKVIGQAIIELVSNNEHGEKLLESLQSTCNSVMLPNDGYLCVTNEMGKVIAVPNLMPEMEMFLSESALTPLDNKKKSTFVTHLNSDEIFQGFIENQNNKHTEIITSLPIKHSNFRISVHQNTETIRNKASESVQKFLVLGVITSVFLGFVIYFFTSRIVNRYESKIEQKNKELSKALHEITKQKEEISKISESLTQSIRYAQNIQKAVLPPNETFANLLPSHFIIFKPRDIVSGDFYWIKEIDSKIVIIAADSTGHGVPGAFMSMLGVAFLNEIINETTLSKPDSAAYILDMLRTKIKTSLRQTGDFDEQKDGMDMALCILNSEEKTLEYAGANNPLYILRKENEAVKLIELKANKQPVGIHLKEEKFNNVVFEMQKGDKFYLFSDGFVDQFGGEKGRKFMKKSFKELLIANFDKDFKQQEQIFNETYNNWVTDKYEQIDDILIIGFS